MDQLMVLVNVDDDSWTLGTDYGDESLASEYDDDFNKAMLMLKNCAACLSEARLFDKVKMEQQRQQSVGLAHTMIEI
jgi:hypothetical protein